MNTMILQGTISTPVQIASVGNEVVATFEVRPFSTDGTPTHSLPVTWHSKDFLDEVSLLEEGDRVKVLGSLTRRFVRRSGKPVTRIVIRVEQLLPMAGA